MKHRDEFPNLHNVFWLLTLRQYKMANKSPKKPVQGVKNEVFTYEQQLNVDLCVNVILSCINYLLGEYFINGVIVCCCLCIKIPFPFFQLLIVHPKP